MLHAFMPQAIPRADRFHPGEMRPPSPWEGAVTRRPEVSSRVKNVVLALAAFALVAATTGAQADQQVRRYRAEQPGFYGDSPRYAVRPSYGFYRPFGFARPRGYMRPYGYQSPPIIAPFGPMRRPYREFRPY